MAADRNRSEKVGDHVRIHRRGRTWYANFQYGDGAERGQRRVSLKTANKKQAILAALRLDTQVAAGSWGQPAARAFTIGGAADAYLRQEAAAGWADRTRAKYAQVLGRLVAFAAGRKVTALPGLTRSLAEAYLTARVDDGAAPKTRYFEGTLIRQLVKHALACDLLAADPLKGWRVKKPRKAEPPCWAWPDVLRILEASPPAIRPALTILAHTGMRVGELSWLTWADVDHDARVLRVRPKDGWRLKAGDARTVPLTPPVRAVLNTLPKGHRWVVPMPPSRTHPESGRQWTERRLLAALKRVLKGLGLPGHLHTFRHSFVSHAVASGTSPAVVKKWVGHVSDEMPAHYTHVHDEVSQAAMRRPFGSEEGPGGK